MAPEDDFYTAWDGRQYVGSPPSGWFLAADNRWWPSPEMIENDEPGAGNDYFDPDPDPNMDPNIGNLTAGPGDQELTAGSNPPPTASVSQPEASWAPEPKSGPPAEPQPPVRSTTAPSPGSSSGTSTGPGSAAPTSTGQTSTGGGVSQSGRRRGGRNGFPVWRVVVLFFILSRCGVFDEIGDAFSSSDDGPGQTTEPAFEEFTVVVGCSTNFLLGSVTNNTDSSATFVLTTARLDEGPNYQSEETSLAPRSTDAWEIRYPTDNERPGFCPPVEVRVDP